jgi:broad specificity phosphatase PhoE
MPKLILVKHARPEIVSNQPPEMWRLSEEGRASCALLATQLTKYELQLVVSSDEAKAIETAELLARDLRIGHEIAPDLHEHDRSNVPHMPSREFISHIELMFRRPAQRVLGRESADEAADRFERAVRGCIQRHRERSIAIISHGTVISLVIARHNDCNAFDLWRRMALPSYAVLSSADLTLQELVERVE